MSCKFSLQLKQGAGDLWMCVCVCGSGSGSLGAADLSCSPPLSHPSPPLRRGSQERTEHHWPASVIENKQWLVLSGLSAIHSKRTLHHCMRGSKSPAHRGNTQNPEDSERIEPPGLQNLCLICDLLAVFL